MFTKRELRTLPLQEIEARCVRLSDYEQMSRALYVAIPTSDTRLGREFASYRSRWFDDKLHQFRDGMAWLDALGEAIATVARVEALISAARAEAFDECAGIAQERSRRAFASREQYAARDEAAAIEQAIRARKDSAE